MADKQWDVDIPPSGMVSLRVRNNLPVDFVEQSVVAVRDSIASDMDIFIRGQLLDILQEQKIVRDGVSDPHFRERIKLSTEFSRYYTSGNPQRRAPWFSANIKWDAPYAATVESGRTVGAHIPPFLRFGDTYEPGGQSYGNRFADWVMHKDDKGASRKWSAQNLRGRVESIKAYHENKAKRFQEKADRIFKSRDKIISEQAAKAKQDAYFREAHLMLQNGKGMIDGAGSLKGNGRNEISKMLRSSNEIERSAIYRLRAWLANYKGEHKEQQTTPHLNVAANASPEQIAMAFAVAHRMANSGGSMRKVPVAALLTPTKGGKHPGKSYIEWKYPPDALKQAYIRSKVFAFARSIQMHGTKPQPYIATYRDLIERALAAKLKFAVDDAIKLLSGGNVKGSISKTAFDRIMRG